MKIYEEEITNVQFYSTEALDGIKLLANPYFNTEETKRLKDLGVIFCRDEDHNQAVFYKEIGKEDEPVQAFYNWIRFDEYGEIHQWVIKNRTATVDYMDSTKVKRTLEGKKPIKELKETPKEK